MEGTNRTQPNLRVGSFNCNGLGNTSKRENVMRWLAAKQEDIILIQRYRKLIVQRVLKETWRRSWEGEVIFNHGTSNSTGVAFLFKRNNSVKVCRHQIIVQGRTSLVEIEHENVKYCLINVYCPNNNDTTVAETTFSEALGRPRDDFLIFAGDWNTVLNNSLDKEGGNPSHSNSNRQNYLNEMISDYGISDIFRLNSGNQRIYTHFNKQHRTRTRLDFFLIDDNLVNFPVCYSEITHGFSSDHSYVSLTIQGSQIERGKGYWKLNNSHLSNENFKNCVREIINETAAQSYDSYSGLWDVIKMKIKDFAIRYGKKLKKDKEREKNRLQDEMEMIKSNNNFMNNDDLRQRYFDSEVKLDKIIRQEIQGAITRSKIQWTEEGERSTKFFFGLEKSSAKKKAITRLVDGEGNELVNQRDISDHVVNFYQRLYTANYVGNQSDMSEYISSSNLNVIDSDLRNSIDGNITLLECEEVIKKFKNNKSPGWDGLTAEFYKCFWDDIKYILYNSFQESIDRGTLTPSQRIGVLTLLPKPKTPSELLHIKNWRPITLLNVDYKIYAHIIKGRIVRTLPRIICKTQSGFQAGKSTCDNLILMCLTLEHFNENTEEKGLVMQVDLEKAFDSVNHNFLFDILHKVGFGDYIIKLVKIAFNGCFSYANINGHLSSPIYLLKGLHQGSPLSPVLFLLVSQVLTGKITSNPNIRGLKISGVDILNSLFADDTDLFLEPSASSVKAVIDELIDFGRYSGCKPNINKTSCIPLGAANNDTELLNQLKQDHGDNFISQTFTALGIKFDNSLSVNDMCEINYKHKLDKATAHVKTWNKRNLTLMGKCQLIKSLLFAQFIYLIVPLPRPNNIMIKSIERLIFNFLWGGKVDKLRRDIVSRPRDLGGLDLFLPRHFIIGLKVSLIGKILNSSFNHLWKEIVINQLKYPNLINISVENKLSSKNSGFTYDLLNCYYEWKINAAVAGNGTVDHCIWGNNMITDIGSRLWNQALIDKNILYISQFLTENGEVMTYHQFKSKWNISELTSLDYVNIKMAIRRFDCPDNRNKNIRYIDPEISLTFLSKRDRARPVRSKDIRDKMVSREDPKNLPPMSQWDGDLNKRINWMNVFTNIFFGFSNNFTLIQFHYKLWHKISTCRYMRHKMKIDLDSPMCSLCNEEIETLAHIFLKCAVTQEFTNQVNTFIRNKLENSYTGQRHCAITLSHPEQRINFVNAVANWYLSRSFQSKARPIFAVFLRHLKLFLLGEKNYISSGFQNLNP